MARAKSGTRIANLHISNDVKDSTWITNHYNGLLDTTNDTVVPLLDEAGLPLLDEAGTALTDETVRDGDSEVLTISFVGNENPTPDSETGLFKAT